MSDTKVLVLRTCNADLTSYGGFVWPKKGRVRCKDWNPEPVCGGGLHGLLWGEGDGSLLSWAEDAKWLVVEVDANDVVSLTGKVKFPAGRVVHCGDRESATSYLRDNGGDGKAIVGGTATAGDRGSLAVKFWDGVRYRVVAADVGENGIEPNVPYRVENGKLVKVSR